MGIRFFSDLSSQDVAIAGGKGASLGEMTRAGIPVPPGFVVLSSVFDNFLEHASLNERIQIWLDKLDERDLAAVENVSQTIQKLILDSPISSDIDQEVLSAFCQLNAPFVAVRSSATAEDSSTASWAGELESYLNTTEERLLNQIKKCWASLFAPRAIIYRIEQGMRNAHVSVAVVVQAMVQSEISGITFTVHPVTKNTQQMIIEACWGLGELIVGGQVTPDSYVFDKQSQSIIDVSVSSQETQLQRGVNGNEMAPVPPSQAEAHKLSTEQIQEIARICLKIEAHYGFPCDIEWAWQNNKFYIVQSRPITTL